MKKNWGMRLKTSSAPLNALNSIPDLNMFMLLFIFPYSSCNYDCYNKYYYNPCDKHSNKNDNIKVLIISHYRAARWTARCDISTCKSKKGRWRLLSKHSKALMTAYYDQQLVKSYRLKDAMQLRHLQPLTHWRVKGLFYLLSF